MTPVWFWFQAFNRFLPDHYEVQEKVINSLNMWDRMSSVQLASLVALLLVLILLRISFPDASIEGIN